MLDKKEMKFTIENTIDLRYVNVENMIDELNREGHAEIIDVQLLDKKPE